MQNLIDRLRPLVGLKGWDYCVLWKTEDIMQHLRTNSCDLLAQLPSSLPFRAFLVEFLYRDSYRIK
ncbi:transcription factor ABORTED MICROSPORES-like [Pyrus ussuriensis x Pyrus communis]|uniref:Transcription factor ABORTED MICROSPORES-like n=1 Tax=Pyrus ussuriensis x Pyrus communis TaxID=2448454 RepID=A0A5N5FGZ4_9ROSA|nr:transcription factor ABORTED MICROSPORES-like [Pyrus ussuriensis x Pyrus communis]